MGKAVQAVKDLASVVYHYYKVDRLVIGVATGKELQAYFNMVGSQVHEAHGFLNALREGCDIGISQDALKMLVDIAYKGWADSVTRSQEYNGASMEVNKYMYNERKRLFEAYVYAVNLARRKGLNVQYKEAP